MLNKVCLITGCSLEDARLGQTVWGDLHALGDVFIFDACLNASGRANWTDKDPSAERRGPVVCIHGGDYFQARGVIVFAKLSATVSKEARAHIAKEVKL